MYDAAELRMAVVVMTVTDSVVSSGRARSSPWSFSFVTPGTSRLSMGARQSEDATEAGDRAEQHARGVTAGPWAVWALEA